MAGSLTEIRFDFTDRTIVVTGASRGIGRSLAMAFARNGADLILTARTREALAEIERDVLALGRSAICLGLDQRNVAAVAECFAGLPPIDSLINNAGVEEVRPSLEVDEDLWDRIVDTNLKGAFFVAQSAARGMAKRGRGSIVNLASLTSFVGVPTAVPYGSSKAGILGMTRALAAEWAPLGIRVNAIAPGYFQTDLTGQFYSDPSWVAAMTAKVPMGRLGRLEDLAGVTMFLASEAAGYISGECIVVDGGYLSKI